MDAKAHKKRKQFEAIINAKEQLDRFKSSSFLEVVYSAKNLAAVVQQLISSKAGLSSLTEAMRFDLSTKFMNGPAAELLLSFHKSGLPDIGSGSLLQPILLAIVVPSIFWDSFLDAFRKKLLKDSSERAFGWLLLHLIRLPKGECEPFREIARDTTILKRLLDSSDIETHTFGVKIQDVIATFDMGDFHGLDNYRPGGRHDNDFADFREIAILPTAGELLSKEHPFLRGITMLTDPETAPNRVALHLDNQFRLLREDMLYEMREELNPDSLQRRGKKKRRALSITGLSLVDLHLKPSDKEDRRCNWGLIFECQEGLIKGSPKDRKRFLADNPNFIKHQSFVCFFVDGNVVSFPSIYRDEGLLARHPPQIVLQFQGETSIKKTLKRVYFAKEIKLVQVDAPIFAYEPVLRALQEKNELPLSEELLHWTEESLVNRISKIPSSLIEALETAAHVGVDLKDLLNIPNSCKLDDSQMRSLMMGLTHRVSLIQGPPGTGKSFIGALLTKVLHDRTSEVILVVCYTNHALDQFIEDLLNIGIPKSQLVRLGGKASAQTESLSLAKQPKVSRLGRLDWSMIESLKARCAEESQALLTFFDEYQKFFPHRRMDSIMDHIEITNPEFFNAFQVFFDSDEVMVGKGGKDVKPTYLLERWMSGHDAGIFKNKDHVLESATVWATDPDSRKSTVSGWVDEMLDDIIDLFYSRANGYTALRNHLDKKFSEGDIAVIKSKRIIACTTTGAAKYREGIAAAKPGILIVEEAGEILESHILTALSSEVKQMILIGDHMQLRPKVNNYALTVERGEGFDLNQSLFERLVKQGYPHEALRQQHRMRPEISDLVRQLTYKDLLDAPSTLKRQNIRGIDSNIIFIDHSHPEEEFAQIHDGRDGGSKSSKKNKYEVEMVWKIVRYLGQQGYGTGNIVVLTPYLGQLRELREALRKDADPILNDLDSFDLIRAGLLTDSAAQLTRKSIRLATIDNYQGEESDIVIVSLTRSNSEHDIGFMAAQERLTVLLSRARDGMILIGNAQTFIKSRKGGLLWGKLFELLKTGGYIYSGLPVHCERHPSRNALVKTPEEFENLCPDGGCMEQCNAKLSCGHTCPSKCHKISDHSKMACEELIRGVCSVGHPIQRRCKDPQKPCSRCEREREEAERKARKDFEHASLMSELDEQIARERNQARQVQDAEDRANALKQKRDDLRLALESAKNATITLASVPAVKTCSVKEPLGKVITSNKDDSKGSPSSARARWEQQKRLNNESNESIDAIMSMIGLEQVKEQVLEIKDKKDVATRQGTDLKKERFNVAMLGNPGTGKTTVARHYAKFLASCQILSSNAFVETTGSRLASEGINGAKKCIENLLGGGGGTLFIDEAYQLTSDHNTGGKQVLDFLLAEMENNVGKIVFIMAGYDKEMEKFWEHNPGLKSRVPYTLRFKDYEDHELLDILEFLIKKTWKGRMKVEDNEGIKGLSGRIAIRRLGRTRGCPGFGNARAVENLLSRIRGRQAKRLTRLRSKNMQPDDLLLTMEDLIGPAPADVEKNCAAWKKLQSMIGLRNVKDAVSSLFQLTKTNYQRELAEKQPQAVALNRVFLGNPGTGKTTVAKLYGQILADLELLSIIFKNPSDFIGGYIGHSEMQTKAILASSMGKVLVIDEAYMLYGGSQGSTAKQDQFRTAVIDTIVAEVQNRPGEDRCVLLLGYKEQMESMFQNINPGFSRRFPMKDAFIFEDYSNEDLWKALDLKLNEGDLTATNSAKQTAIDVLEKARNRPNFGNIGEVENILSEAKTRYQRRQLLLPPDQRSPDAPFEPQDFDPDYNRGENASANLAKLFEDVAGSGETIRMLGTWQVVAKNSKARGKDPRDLIPTSFVFKGPPGTGKTTTARKFGRVYFDMGILGSTDVVECSATDLVGQYVGHTGPKVKGMFEKALGRVLFIDEAYRLGEGQFGKEAMDEMVALMTSEQFKGRMIVILAGYDTEINDLLSRNPGLSSRFPQEIVFPGMPPTQCIEVLRSYLRKQGVQVNELEDSESPGYRQVLEKFGILSRFPSWGNARDVIEAGKRMATYAFSRIGPEKGNNGSSSASSLILPVKEVISTLMSMHSTLKERTMNVSVRAGNMAESVRQCVNDASLPPPINATTSGGQHKAKGVSSFQAELDRDALCDSESDSKGASDGDSEDEDVRDPGVEDEVWRQLRINKQLMREEERRRDEHTDNLKRGMEADKERANKAQRTLDAITRKAARNDVEKEALMRQREEERLRAHTAQLELAKKAAALEEEKRKKNEEARVQRKLREMGVCVAGFRWIKESNGYRCAGGSHFMSNAQLGI